MGRIIPNATSLLLNIKLQFLKQSQFSHRTITFDDDDDF